MKITCQRSAMLAACNTAFKVTPAKNLRPVLQCVKITLDGKGCTLSSTDNEMWLRVSVAEVNNDDEGEAMLPPKLLNILKESDSEEVNLDLSDTSCKVILRNGKFEMASFPVSEFPSFDAIDFSKAIELGGEMFAEMVNKTIFAAGSAGESKIGAVTNGIFISLADGKLSMTGANSKALATMHYDAPYSEESSKVVPKKFLELAAASVAETVQIDLFTDNSISIKTGRIELRSRLVDGRYPRVENIIPKNERFNAKIDVGSLLSAVKQTAIMTDEMTNRIKFVFNAGKLSLSATESVHGKSAIEIDVESGGELEMLFNPTIWIAMLSKLDSGSMIEFAGTDARTPALITQGNYRFVAVPLWFEEGKK